MAPGLWIGELGRAWRTFPMKERDPCGRRRREGGRCGDKQKAAGAPRIGAAENHDTLAQEEHAG